MSKILWEGGEARRMGRREGRGGKEDDGKEGGKVKEREREIRKKNEIKLTCTLHLAILGP